MIDKDNKMPNKCCFNCVNGMQFAVPRKDNSEYDRVVRFNSEKRICGENYRMPSYPMYEKRSCKGFEKKTAL